jgi:hypothetical protein
MTGEVAGMTKGVAGMTGREHGDDVVSTPETVRLHSDFLLLSQPPRICHPSMRRKERLTEAGQTGAERPAVAREPMLRSLESKP